MNDPRPFLAFAHIGDAHVSDRVPAHAETLAKIVGDLGTTGDALHFAFLPGDNADNGLPAQYAQVRDILDRLALPVHVITGDHDMEGGGLDAFYAGLRAPRLPYGIDRGGTRCLFLDMCGPGSGGPDFRLGPDQVAWLAEELDAATARHQSCAVFMHSYPADLKGEGEAARVAALLHHGPVRLVEMGHTHYNELANDGRTIYAAARSTGQIEEGPAGYAVAAIDAGVVSWRFRDLGRPWPFVIVTYPADRRLAHDPSHLAGDGVVVRALTLGLGHGVCEVAVDDGPWQPMRRHAGEGRWEIDLAGPAGPRRITVRATRPDGCTDSDTVEVATALSEIPTSRGIGSDRDAIGTWAEKGLLGTQLGPNRNGRAW